MKSCNIFLFCFSSHRSSFHCHYCPPGLIFHSSHSHNAMSQIVTTLDREILLMLVSSSTFTQSKEQTCLDSRSNSCSWAASHASCVTQHIILTQDTCNSYNRVCNPNIQRHSIVSLLSLLSDGENNDDCSVWREDRGMWWNVRLCGIRFYLFQEDFSDAERAAALQLPLKSHSITAPPTSTSTHFSSNSLKLYFLRPDRLFRDPGVIIK